MPKEQKVEIYTQDDLDYDLERLQELLDLSADLLCSNESSERERGKLLVTIARDMTKAMGEKLRAGFPLRAADDKRKAA